MKGFACSIRDSPTAVQSNRALVVIWCGSMSKPPGKVNFESSCHGRGRIYRQRGGIRVNSGGA